MCWRGIACAEEDKDGWSCLLQDLRRRGATQMDLIVTDGHEGLLAAVAALFSATPRQRCLVHKQRNVMNAIPKREHERIAAELAGIWNQPTKEQAMTELAAFKGKYRERYPEAVRSVCEDEEHLLTFYAFPQAMHRYIRSSNASESFFRNVRRRTDHIDTLYFGNQLSLDCLGCDARHSFVKDFCLVIGFRRKAGEVVSSQPSSTGLGGPFCLFCWPASLVVLCQH